MRMNMNSNAGNRGKIGFQRSSTGYIVVMVIILIAAILIWYYYTKKRTLANTQFNPVLISQPIMMTDSKLQSMQLDIPAEHPYGLQYTYSYWINVHDLDYNYGRRKNVFFNGTAATPSGGDNNPYVYIAENTNTLMIQIGTSIFGIQNFPMMRWVHVGMVLNNRSMDVYIDGKLERSFILAAIPTLTTSSNTFIVGNGTNVDTFSGKISRLQYFSKALGPTDVYDLYLQGPLPAAIFS